MIINRPYKIKSSTEEVRSLYQELDQCLSGYNDYCLGYNDLRLITDSHIQFYPYDEGIIIQFVLMESLDHTFNNCIEVSFKIHRNGSIFECSDRSQVMDQNLRDQIKSFETRLNEHPYIIKKLYKYLSNQIVLIDTQINP